MEEIEHFQEATVFRNTLNSDASELASDSTVEKFFPELLDWVRSASELPDGLDDLFVCSYQIRIDSEDMISFPDDMTVPITDKHFRLLITTRRLLQLASSITTLHADSTYKLNWNNYPVQVLGCTGAFLFFLWARLRSMSRNNI